MFGPIIAGGGLLFTALVVTVITHLTCRKGKDAYVRSGTDGMAVSQSLISSSSCGKSPSFSSDSGDGGC